MYLGELGIIVEKLIVQVRRIISIYIYKKRNCSNDFRGFNSSYKYIVRVFGIKGESKSS